MIDRPANAASVASTRERIRRKVTSSAKVYVVWMGFRLAFSPTVRQNEAQSSLTKASDKEIAAEPSRQSIKEKRSSSGAISSIRGAFGRCLGRHLNATTFGAQIWYRGLLWDGNVHEFQDISGLK
ncbi:predicted protein [Histoplasma capsulatum G186AR]|uniref:Uncharacterized protein n=1 Tax=Ajellomyces capsulatus (strain G186AR / H82 / ATCC MYA-2454 / RMSCC 2432) TaxID=447093 RepID=C0P0K0_AJECG|nr:uncharacterized protein HCBG_08930 [Histoplasma capsulatum G186AR]EEH02820.1 predicted protein [Histoplasma capsulatum G186AR]